MQVESISRVSVWGEDAIDLSSATLGGKWALDVVGDWTPDASPPDAAVAADAIVSHMKDWALGRCAAALLRPRRLPLCSQSHAREALPTPGKCIAAFKRGAARAPLRASTCPLPPRPARSDGKWSSMGVPATGDYGLGSGFFYSVRVVCRSHSPAPLIQHCTSPIPGFPVVWPCFAR